MPRHSSFAGETTQCVQTTLRKDVNTLLALSILSSALSMNQPPLHEASPMKRKSTYGSAAMPSPPDRRPSDPVNSPHPGVPLQFRQNEQLGRNVESNPTYATAPMSSPARPAPPAPDQRARDSMKVAHDGRRPGHDEQLGQDQKPGHGRHPVLSEEFRLEQDAEYVSNLHKVIVSRFLPSFLASLPSLPPFLFSLHLVAYIRSIHDRLTRRTCRNI